MNEDIEPYIKTLRRLAGVNNDTELASKIGVAKQTISSWRRRRAVPIKMQRALAAVFGPEAMLNSALQYWASEAERELVISILIAILDIVGPSPERGDYQGYARWGQALAHCEEAVRDAIRQLHFVVAEDSAAEIVEMVILMIRSGKLPTVSHAIDVWVTDKYGIG